MKYEDMGKWLKGETPGQPLPEPGVIADLVDFYYQIPTAFKGADGNVDWDSGEEMQRLFMEGLNGVDAQAGVRLTANIEPSTPHTLEQLYFTTLDQVSEYYKQVPAGAPDTGATWYQYQLPWLRENPQSEALMFLLGYRNDVVTKEAADVVHALAPGQDVNIKSYR